MPRASSHGVGGGGEIVPTTTGSPILQPEALYCNQKLDPTTTEQLFTQKRSLLQLEPSILFSARLCSQYSVVKGCVGALYSVVDCFARSTTISL